MKNEQKETEEIYSKINQVKGLDKSKKVNILLNKSYGGFTLSKEAYEELGLEWDGFGYKFNEKRGDPKLIEVAFKLGDKVSLTPGDIRIIEITINDVLNGFLDNYDGYESISYEYSYLRTPIIDIF